MEFAIETVHSTPSFNSKQFLYHSTRPKKYICYHELKTMSTIATYLSLTRARPRGWSARSLSNNCNSAYSYSATRIFFTSRGYDSTGISLALFNVMYTVHRPLFFRGIVDPLSHASVELPPSWFVTANQDGGSWIEESESRQSHEKKEKENGGLWTVYILLVIIC